ncbi:MAG TPA: hypothetical protein VFZ59_14885 [Verrucomicrobiae bacterium]|nr:hypothetical protein [Verrucomicrobiae bacterium]
MNFILTGMGIINSRIAVFHAGADDPFVAAAFFAQRAIPQRCPAAREKRFSEEEFDAFLGIGWQWRLSGRGTPESGIGGGGLSGPGILGHSGW